MNAQVMDSPMFVVDPVAAVAGEITVPGDKSISHRALMFGGMAQGETNISGFLQGEDCLSTLKALRQLGVAIEHSGDGQVRVQGAGMGGLRPAASALDMGNAGTAMRLFMGLLCGQQFGSTLVGDQSLMRRPMERVAKPLRAMGASIETDDGRPPVVIRGGTALKAIEYAMPVASAQVKSAVLIAGLMASGTTSVIEPAPSRDHSERMLAQFGVKVQRHGPRVSIEGGQVLRACQVRVPADFSSAAFFVVAGCLAARPELVIRNVGVNPTRTGLLDMLRLMGAQIDVRPVGVTTEGEPMADLHVRASKLRGIRVPEALVPLAIDEFPAFFIAAACAEGETVVTGAGELRVKESDRLAVMAEGLQALGVTCQLLPDGIRIQGGPMRGGRVDSHGDHRIAMAFAMASVCASDRIEIGDVANVATSFPGFPDTARAVGLRLKA